MHSGRHDLLFTQGPHRFAGHGLEEEGERGGSVGREMMEVVLKGRFKLARNHVEAFVVLFSVVLCGVGVVALLGL